MDWIVRYSKKGTNIIKTEVLKTHFTHRLDVIRWWAKNRSIHWNWRAYDKISLARTDYIVHGVHDAGKCALWGIDRKNKNK
jgi:hypothetical protein